MRLAAISSGIYAPWGVPGPSFDGTVHSVFERAVNLSLGARDLISLVAAELGNQPRAYLVELPRAEISGAFDFTRRLAVGQGLACRGGILRFTNSDLSVDLRPARPWRCGIATLGLDLGKPEVARAYATASHLLVAHPKGGDFARLAADPIENLEAAAARLDLLAAQTAAARLIGLGSGLTPAGDDFLVGFLAALWSLDLGDDPRRGFRASFADYVANAAHGTHEISRCFLEAAAEGEVSERLADFAAAIARGASDADLRLACAAALAVGASSGADGIAGYLSGVAACADALLLLE
jgi:hypothetical protein